MDLNYLVIGIAIVQTLYAALTYHQSRENPTSSRAVGFSLVSIIVFSALSWLAVGVDLYGRYTIYHETADAVFVSYGLSPPNTFQAVAQFKSYSSLKEYKALLIARVAYADRDRMDDDWISKSISYNISSDQLQLATNPLTSKVRFAANIANTVEYNLVILPHNISVDRINNIGDVERLGGRILASAGQGGIPGGPPDRDGPQSSSKP